mmetsp:Transcript_1450/g.2018  ORF Transcript_1450/g.2018 Transcript_1450/m.2018 type:complete len:86 (+) Transcript_1450:152-409(+)
MSSFWQVFTVLLLLYVADVTSLETKNVQPRLRKQRRAKPNAANRRRRVQNESTGYELLGTEPNNMVEYLLRTARTGDTMSMQTSN